MLYREIQPKPDLGRFVECFWTLEDDGAPGPVNPEPILPDGCVELILNFGERFNEHRDDGREEPQPLHFLVGQMTRPMLIAPTGRVELVGIRFQPGGAFPFFPLPMSEVTNRIVELGALDSRLEGDLVSLVSEAPSLSRKVAAIENYFIKRLRQCQHDSWLPALAASIVRNGGLKSVDQLAVDVGVSGRQLQRRFLREVGVGPKLLSRILRFQQVFRAVEHNEEGWARLAAECGYYDQAHLIRDFQQFARETPAVLLAHTSPLTESFTRKRRVSHFSNTIA